MVGKINNMIFISKNKYLTNIQIPREPRIEIQDISSNFKRVQIVKSKKSKVIYSNPKIRIQNNSLKSKKYPNNVFESIRD